MIHKLHSARGEPLLPTLYQYLVPRNTNATVCQDCQDLCSNRADLDSRSQDGACTCCMSAFLRVATATAMPSHTVSSFPADQTSMIDGSSSLESNQSAA